MIKTAIDNDVLIKCSLLGALSAVPSALSVEIADVGVLGAARFVVSKRIPRLAPNSRQPDVLLEIQEFFKGCSSLEPTVDELSFSAALEFEAQKQGLPFDSGESQLFAILIMRPLSLLVTGDKRAICSIPALMAKFPLLEESDNKVMCLEQLVVSLINCGSHSTIRDGLAESPKMDQTLSICFMLHNGDASPADTVDALGSYIDYLRAASGKLLVG